jgi:hypothetical protein
MLDPPFLELEYYVGRSWIGAAMAHLAAGVRPIGKMKLPGAVGLIRELEELEIFGGVVVLRTEGESFCGPPGMDRTRAKALGLEVYRRFLEVAQAIPFYYGAILVEYSLEEPRQLLEDPRSLAFRDFALNREHLGEQAVEDVVRLIGNDAYFERRGSITYVSMSAEFNPERKDLPIWEDLERTARLCKIIGRAATSRG